MLLFFSISSLNRGREGGRYGASRATSPGLVRCGTVLSQHTTHNTPNPVDRGTVGYIAGTTLARAKGGNTGV